jgi:ribosomal-protein-alanine N-acetyltransferase
MLARVIASERLDLVLLSSEAIDALVGGRHAEAEAAVGAAIPRSWPDEHDARFLRYRMRQLSDDPTARPWLVRAVVRREPDREVVGHAGFHGPPGVNAKQDPTAVELGYSVFEPHRGRGYATEAVRALMEFAQAEHGIERFIASVAPNNAPSLAIVHKLGFVQTGEQWDEEDGLELVFELESPQSSSS